MGFGVAPPSPRGVVNYRENRKPLYDGSWEVKVLWAGGPSYAGPIVIRGAQIDGSYQLVFPTGEPMTIKSSLNFPAGSSHAWRYYATSTLLRHAGCYAFQIDGLSFSKIVVFKAIRGALGASP
jgi:hypothetical protein